MALSRRSVARPFLRIAMAAIAVVVLLPGVVSAQSSRTSANQGPLAGFTLVDASDQSVLATLSDGATVELDDPAGGSYAIRVDTRAKAGSVRLQLTGQKSVNKTERVAPWSLYGDDGTSLHGEALPAGSYTLRAAAFSHAGNLGHLLGTLEVSFTVVAAGSSTGGTLGDTAGGPATPESSWVTPASSPLAGFSLIDAADQSVLATLSDGATVELDDPEGGSYAVRVDTGPDVGVGSVRLELSGHKSVDKTENIVPYSLYGDDGTSLHGEALPAGSYTLRASAYAQRKLRGSLLGTLEVTFTVTTPVTTPAAEASVAQGLTPATLEFGLVGYSAEQGAGTLEPDEVTFDGEAMFRVTSLNSLPGVPGLVLFLASGSPARDTALAATHFVLEADEQVLIVGTTEFSFDDATLSYSNRTVGNGEYGGVAIAAWADGDAALTAGDTVPFRLERRDRPEEAQNTPLIANPPPADSRDSLDTTTLVSNTGLPESSSAVRLIDGQQLSQCFKLGSHGQGYALSSVLIDLAEAPSRLTVSLWQAGHDVATPSHKMFDFDNPSALTAGLNEFTAPPGAFAYQNINYCIVLSDYGGIGSVLRLSASSSTSEDDGGESGATIRNVVDRRGATGTGRWTTATQFSFRLRIAVMGSRRHSGVLVSNFARDGSSDTTVGRGDRAGIGIDVGAADRYLIRSFSMQTGPTNRMATREPINLYDLDADDDLDTKLFSLKFPPEAGTGEHQSNYTVLTWRAQQGATVEGAGETYVFVIEDFPADTSLITLYDIEVTDADSEDSPAAPGIALFDNLKEYNASGEEHDSHDAQALVGVQGEPLHAMVQNFGQTDNSYLSLGGDGNHHVVSQGFTTGPNDFGYRLKGIGVNIEGSGNQFPAGASSVAVAVHADAGGEPGEKLFDLTDPGEFGAGHSFFEAPAGATLAPDTSYVMVWRYLGSTWHRLQKTAGNAEDSGALAGASIADAFYSGADVDSLTANSGGDVLEIAVYAEANEDAPFVAGGRGVGRNWIHTPEGLEVGDQFRLLFLTDNGTFAHSSDIDDYNEFVQNKAASHYNNRRIQRVASQFKAVVCTAAVNARTNTAMPQNEVGVPIHWLDGGYEKFPTLVARSNADFFDGAWDSGDKAAYPYGNAAYVWHGTRVWTGCTSSGQSKAGDTMGSTTVGYGAPGLTGLSNYRRQALHSAAITPVGVWGNETTIWVGNEAADSSPNDKIHAYRRSNGTHDSAKDFNTLSAAGNRGPVGLCSDGTTMFVLDSTDDKVYAYKMSDKSRDATKDIELDSVPGAPRGLGCDANTIWVLNDSTGDNNKIFAYRRSDGNRDSANDFDTLWAAGNHAPVGLYSDGTTMFVADHVDDKVYAYRMSDKSLDLGRTLELGRFNVRPRGLWSDGSTLWVADSSDNHLHLYDLPESSALESDVPAPYNDRHPGPNHPGILRPLYAISPVFTVVR